jgi:hypothetical protein
MDPSIAFSAGRWLLLAAALTCRGIPRVGPAGVPEVGPAVAAAAGPDVGPNPAIGEDTGDNDGSESGVDGSSETSRA